MQTIPLDLVPNQSFSALLDDQLYDMRLVALPNGLAVDITRSGVVLVTGSRVLPGEFLIPYDYLAAGNFLMLTDGDAIPTWEAPGTLVYLSADELAVIYAN
jgi:hypothetical protein